MITEADWSTFQAALRLAQDAAEVHAVDAEEAGDERLRDQFEADARKYEELRSKTEREPSWFEVWAALDVVADVVEGRNLDDEACLECDEEVDEEGVCVAGECRLREGLLVHRGQPS